MNATLSVLSKDRIDSSHSVLEDMSNGKLVGRVVLRY